MKNIHHLVCLNLYYKLIGGKWHVWCGVKEEDDPENTGWVLSSMYGEHAEMYPLGAGAPWPNDWDIELVTEEELDW